MQLKHDIYNRLARALAGMFVLLLLGSGIAWADEVDFAGEVQAIRFSGNAEQTRIVIELDAKPEYRWFTLAVNGSRLVLDFARLSWNLDGAGPVDTGEGTGDGVVSRFRYAKNAQRVSRLVFELAEPVVVAREFYLEPTEKNSSHRLVLDLEKTDLISFIAGSGFSEPFVPAPASNVSVRPPPHLPVLAPSLKPAGVQSKWVVVIDAGHGGKDPGTIGKVKKTREKNVNLRAALALKKRLERSGKYKVILTRSTDRFIKLDGRVSIARKKKADLFISLHADAVGNPKARGASVYTLAEAASRRSRPEILKGNNWLIDVKLAASRPVVNDILFDLSQRQTKNQSSVFAELLIPRLAKVGPLIGNSHRKENIFVLLAPDVPAVLIEMGFLSNKKDEKNLNSSRYIKNLTNAIGSSVDTYFRQVERLQASN
ncbi:N-acetylmuramoyl-L-alanine amidase [hydrothermal vent metagenome]|uniref:N-acetylmuramoyl-L-alanine amidase n=1 Tax=hydrothermal vent metagenome TaxID=652676 RepID=A0A3B0SE90_9ZZZZ